MVYVLAGKPDRTLMVGPFITLDHAAVWISVRNLQVWQWFKLSHVPVGACSPDQAEGV